MGVFDEATLALFRFLETEYGYEFVKKEEYSRLCRITYSNKYVGIGIRIELEDSCVISVFVYRLVDGIFRENSYPITDISDIYSFDFSDTVPEIIRLKPLYKYGSGATVEDAKNSTYNYIREYADIVKEHGDRILRGDLSRSLLNKIKKGIMSRQRDA